VAGSGRLTSRRQRQEEVKRQQRRRYLLIGVPVGLLVVSFAALAIFRATGVAIAGLAEFGPQEREHDAAVSYEGDLPPVGGVHSPVWQNCGIYDVPVDSANAVHSMEHGAVWMAYDPDALTGPEVESLRDRVRGRSYLLLSPYPGLSSPVVLTAWGVQLEVDSADDERISQFISQYRLGPQTPEFGAACDGGVGAPIG
jgi:hypothetical protein